MNKEKIGLLIDLAQTKQFNKEELWSMKYSNNINTIQLTIYAIIKIINILLQ